MDFDERVNGLAKLGYEIFDFKYIEYINNVKGEGVVVMQSYVAVMKKP